MENINTWRDNLFPLVKKYFDLRLEKKRSIMAQVIGIETTDMYQLQEKGIGGLGEVPKYDGNEIKELHQYTGFKTTYITEEFAGKTSIGFKLAKLDLSREAKKAGKRVADALYMTQLQDFYRLFSRGFNSSYTGADGKSLFASDHPINSESDSNDTYSNTGVLEFSIASITATQSLMGRWTTYDDLPLLIEPDLCLISVELEPLAKQFFGGEAKLLPQGNYNDNNPVYDMKYVVIRGFTAKQWALADSEQMKEHIKMVQTTAPMVIEQKSTNPLIQEYIGYMDYCMGWSEPKVIFGHNPA